MTNLALPETTALTERGAGVRDLLTRAGAVVEIDPQTSALIASGMRVQALLDRVADDLDVASTLTVVDAETLVEAQTIASRLAAVASDSGEIERERKLLTAPLNAVVKLINSGYQAPRAHIQPVLDGLKRKMLDYHAEMRRQAEEREQAQRAERERVAREAAEREAEAAKRAQELIAEAAQAQKAGSGEAAAAMVQQAGEKMDEARSAAHDAIVAAHTVVQAAPVTMPKGVRGKWTAELTSLDNLILHVAERIKAGDRSLVSLLTLDASMANRRADVERTGFNVPGLRAQFVQSIAVRKAASV